MTNITISMNQQLIDAGRKYAQKHQTSLNALLRKLLAQAVESDSSAWIDECFDKMNKLNVNSEGNLWNREDLYDI